MVRFRLPLLFLGLVLGGAVNAAHAQRGGRGFGRELTPPPEVKNIPYDGRFTFARLAFTNMPGGNYYRGEPAWMHGYPLAEQNLVKIMREVTSLRPHMEGSNVVAIDDPLLFKYPVVYCTEPGWMVLTDKEAAILRAYLQKGGFIIFDDFRENYPNAGWANFVGQMKRVIPDMRFVDLDTKSAIFHSFFDVNASAIPQDYDRGRPILRGAFQNNDPKKRLMIMVNYNTDVSNFWEYSAQGFRPVTESNEAYKLGVNYFLYGLTH